MMKVAAGMRGWMVMYPQVTAHQGIVIELWPKPTDSVTIELVVLQIIGPRHVGSNNEASILSSDGDQHLP